jgi:hypothetical protein
MAKGPSSNFKKFQDLQKQGRLDRGRGFVGPNVPTKSNFMAKHPVLASKHGADRGKFLDNHPKIAAKYFQVTAPTKSTAPSIKPAPTKPVRDVNLKTDPGHPYTAAGRREAQTTTQKRIAADTGSGVRKNPQQSQQPQQPPRVLKPLTPQVQAAVKQRIAKQTPAPVSQINDQPVVPKQVQSNQTAARHAALGKLPAPVGSSNFRVKGVQNVPNLQAKMKPFVSQGVQTGVPNLYKKTKY